MGVTTCLNPIVSPTPMDQPHRWECGPGGDRPCRALRCHRLHGGENPMKNRGFCRSESSTNGEFPSKPELLMELFRECHLSKANYTLHQFGVLFHCQGGWSGPSQYVIFWLTDPRQMRKSSGIIFGQWSHEKAMKIRSPKPPTSWATEANFCWPIRSVPSWSVLDLLEEPQKVPTHLPKKRPFDFPSSGLLFQK